MKMLAKITFVLMTAAAFFTNAAEPLIINREIASIEKNGSFYVYTKTRKIIPKYRDLATNKFVDPENGMIYPGNSKYILVEKKLIKTSPEFVDSLKWVINKKAEITELDSELKNLESEFDLKLKTLKTLCTANGVFSVSSSDLCIVVENIKSRNERLVENTISDLNRINRKYLRVQKKKNPLEQDLMKVEAYIEAFEKKREKAQSDKQ